MVVTNLFNTVFAKMSLPACSILIWQKWWVQTQTQTSAVVLIISGRETRTNSSFYGQTYLHKVESHWRDFMFISIVLDAFVTSVIYKPPYLPPVRFCNNNSCSKHEVQAELVNPAFLLHRCLVLQTWLYYHYHYYCHICYCFNIIIINYHVYTGYLHVYTWDRLCF